MFLLFIILVKTECLQLKELKYVWNFKKHVYFMQLARTVKKNGGADIRSPILQAAKASPQNTKKTLGYMQQGLPWLVGLKGNVEIASDHKPMKRVKNSKEVAKIESFKLVSKQAAPPIRLQSILAEQEGKTTCMIVS